MTKYASKEIDHDREPMNLRALTKAAGVSERQVRYMIAEGFMPAPRGGRAAADYGEDHLEAIRRYQALRRLGFPPAAIRILLEAREGVPFPVAPGVTLVIDPSLIGAEQPIDPMVDKIRATLIAAMEGNPDDARRDTTDPD